MTVAAETAAAPARSVLRPIALGLGVGLGYGVAIRAWMRLVSTDHEFSWSGTGYIVSVFIVLGLSAGTVTAIRYRARPWGVVAVRAVGIALGLGCFVAAGAGMFPTVIAGALAYSRTDWPRWLRIVLAAFAVLSAVALIVTLADLSWARRTIALLCYLPLCAVEVALFSRLLKPTLPRGTFPRGVRVGAVILAVLVVAIGAVAITGIAQGN